MTNHTVISPVKLPGICDRKSGLPSISDIFGKLGKPLEIFFVVINNQLIKHHKLYVIFSCLFKTEPPFIQIVSAKSIPNPQFVGVGTEMVWAWEGARVR
jgi:hypothetical protein